MIQTQKVKKLALNSQLLTVQILTNDVQVLILCLSYLITTVKLLVTQENQGQKGNFKLSALIKHSKKTWSTAETMHEIL